MGENGIDFFRITQDIGFIFIHVGNSFVFWRFGQRLTRPSVAYFSLNFKTLNFEQISVAIYQTLTIRYVHIQNQNHNVK
jgi:hypothetical protein